MKKSSFIYILLVFLFTAHISGIQAKNNCENIFRNSTDFSDSANESSIHATLVLDEAEAVLDILQKKKNNSDITSSDWNKLFTSEGYRRLKNREASMNRPFSDSSFMEFVLSEQTIKASYSLATTLASWKKTDIKAAAKRALNYLPEGAFIRAKIYPIIKPKTNSFVFEVDKDPAIFLYLNPVVTQEQFGNTLTHELHHIGYGSCCPRKSVEAEIEELPAPVRNVVNWTGAFGEGFAMLAAAGGPDVHPHAFSPTEDKERWDNDIKNFNSDLKKVEMFFHDILSKKLKTENEINETGFSFFGIQGPWYTVGWKMSVIIEKTYGKKTLIDCMCDTRTLLKTYNSAAEKYNEANNESLALWSEEIINITE